MGPTAKEKEGVYECMCTREEKGGEGTATKNTGSNRKEKREGKAW